MADRDLDTAGDAGPIGTADPDPRLADYARQAAYLLDLSGVLTWASPTLHSVLGWRPDEVVGTHVESFVHPDDAESAAAWRNVLAGPASPVSATRVRTDPIRMRRSDGEYLWCVISAALTEDAYGRVVGVTGWIHDVDGLITAREEVARAYGLLRAVLDSQVDPYVLFRAIRDDGGAIIDFLYEDANQAALDFEHLTREELIGSTMLQVAPSREEGEADLADTVGVMESGRPGVWNDEPTVDYVDSRGRRIIVDIRIVRIDDDRASYSWRDVTDRHEATRELARSEQRFRLLAETTSDVVSLVRGGLLAWVSPSVTRVLGWDPDELVGTDPLILVHPDDVDEVAAAWVRHPESVLRRRRYRLRRQDGGYHWVDTEGRVVSDKGEGTVELMLSTRVVDAEVAALAALETRARHDALTGLVNRVELFDQVERMLTGQARTGSRLAVAFCDLDGFKAVNDTHGHTAGDVLLRRVAERMQATVRAGDVVSRLGGDEFLVILDGVRDLDDAIRIADKLRQRIFEPVDTPGGSVQVTASVGVTLAEPGETVDDIVARSDAAMYEAKRRGKDDVFAMKGPRA